MESGASVDQISLLQLLSSRASQSLEYTCSSQAGKQSEAFRLIGFDGQRQSLDHKSVKIENDGCQLASMDVSEELW